MNWFKKSGILIGLLSSLVGANIDFYGQVQDKDGKGIAQASVQLIGAGLTVQTDAEGWYHFSGTVGLEKLNSEQTYFEIQDYGIQLNLSPESKYAWKLFSNDGKIIQQSGMRTATTAVFISGTELLRSYHSGIYYLQVSVDGQKSTLILQKSGESFAIKKHTLNAANTLVAVDSMRASKTGYTTSKIQITSYSDTAQTLVLDTNSGSITDVRDGQVYPTVIIGEQTWMAKNINYATTSGSYCYDNDPANCDTYGRLYDWNTANGSGEQAVCPAGWHVPSTAEWDQMGTFLAQENGAKPAKNGWEDIGKLLKANSVLWEDNTGADAYGFAALPAGITYGTGKFHSLGKEAHWWTSTPYNSNTGNDRSLYPTDYLVKKPLSMSYTLSVRCIMD